MNRFEDIINNLNNNCTRIYTISNNISSNFNEDKFNINKEKVNLLLAMSNNINSLIDQLEELNIIILDTKKDSELTSEEKILKRNNKINKLINDKFMPFILYTRLCLENSSNV